MGTNPCHDNQGKLPRYQLLQPVGHMIGQFCRLRFHEHIHVHDKTSPGRAAQTLLDPGNTWMFLDHGNDLPFHLPVHGGIEQVL